MADQNKIGNHVISHVKQFAEDIQQGFTFIGRIFKKIDKEINNEYLAIAVKVTLVAFPIIALIAGLIFAAMHLAHSRLNIQTINQPEGHSTQYAVEQQFEGKYQLETKTFNALDQLAKSLSMPQEISQPNQVLEEIEISPAQVKENMKSRVKELENNLEFLFDKINHKQPILVVEATQFVEYYELVQAAGYSGEKVREVRKMQDYLREYFTKTHQDTEFDQIVISAKRKAFLLMSEGLNFSNVKPDDPALRTYKFLFDGLDDLFKPILNHIEKKGNHYSTTGSFSSIINQEDIKILNNASSMYNSDFSNMYNSDSLEENPRTAVDNSEFVHKTNSVKHLVELYVKNTSQGIAQSLQKHRLREIDCMSFINKATHELTKNELEKVAEAKLLLLEFQNLYGSRTDLSLTAECQHLFKINQLRGDNIDLAMLNLFIKSHDSTSTHPQVAIEGGGPVGLLMAMTQFKSGANVSLFEKRSTQYERTQIVRLDPKWMSTLQLYLGEEYYRIFEDEGHRGTIRSDGFGEIATLFLEEAIHTRLTQLLSLLPAEGDHLPLERFAAHELGGVKKPKIKGGKFTISAKYHSIYDPADKDQSRGVAKETKKKITREIDILICAGGKQSSLKQQFMPSSSAVTESKPYGVCSWLADSIPGQDEEKMSLFKDFRNMVDLNETFFDAFRLKLEEEFQKIFPNSNEFYEISLKISNDVNMLSHTERKHFQTRTFENRGLVYIGMELPEKWESFLSEMRQLMKNLDLSAKESNEMINQIQKIWFQNVMDSYELDKAAGLTMDKIDSKFAASFPVDQYRIDPNHLISHIENDSSELLVTAAGDAFSSPHFMRYSGLTGGRENIFELESYTAAIANKEDKHLAMRTLRHDSEETAMFVIGRGTQFLNPLDEQQIKENKKESIITSLDNKMKALANSKHHKLMKEGDKYVFHDLDTKRMYSVSPEVGYLIVDGTEYDSIDQLILKL